MHDHAVGFEPADQTAAGLELDAAALADLTLDRSEQDQVVRADVGAQMRSRADDEERVGADLARQAPVDARVAGEADSAADRWTDNGT